MLSGAQIFCQWAAQLGPLDENAAAIIPDAIVGMLLRRGGSRDLLEELLYWGLLDG